MNSRTLVIGLACTALGLGTVIGFVKRSHSPSVAAPDEAVEPAVSTAAPGKGRAPKLPAAPSTRQVHEAAASFSWSEVESAEYKDYIANLRAVGCPEQTIRDIIIADVNKLYASRETPLLAKTANPNQPAPAGDAADHERRRKLREVQLEKRTVIKELLGIDIPINAFAGTSKRNYESYEVAFRSLPEGKREAVQNLQENYWQQSDALRARHDNKRTPEYLAEYWQLSDTHRAELGKVLTPDELENYEMRTSSSAIRLARRLAPVTPSEDEFRQIYQTSAQFRDQTRETGVNEPTDAEIRAEATAQMSEQIKGVLGEDRFTEYQRLQDKEYQTFSKLAERYGLAKDTAVQAYELQKAYEQQARELTGERKKMTPEQVAQLNQQRAEAKQALDASLQTLLGERAARAYRRYKGGYNPIEFEN